MHCYTMCVAASSHFAVSHICYCPCPTCWLQQALNMLQGETKPIRRLIEGRFDDIKGITESQTPYLDPELSSWWVP